MNFFEISIECPVVLNGIVDGFGDYHRFCLSLNLLFYFTVEMVHHHFRLFTEGKGMILYISSQLLLCLMGFKLRVLFHRFIELVIALVSGIVFQYIENKLLLDGLFHAVQVEWIKLAGFSCGIIR